MNNTIFNIIFSLFLVIANSDASNAMQLLRDCKKMCSLDKCAGNKARQTECSKKCPKEPCVPLSAPARPSTLPSQLPRESSSVSTIRNLPSYNPAADLDNESIKRIEARSKSREILRQGESLQKSVDDNLKPMKQIGNLASTIASASGDPHAKAAAAALNLGLSSIEGLGKGIALIVVAYGRYKERAQEIKSAIELLYEDAQRTKEKIEKLEKAQQTLIEINRNPIPSQSSSSIKKMADNLNKSAKGMQNRFREATDIFTNDKEKGAKKLQDIQKELKVEKDRYEDVIRLIQIKILEDTWKEIHKKWNIEQTILKLTTDSDELNKLRNNRKSSTPQTDEEIAIENKYIKIIEDLKFYRNYQASPTETRDQLFKSKSELENILRELSAQTKAGESQYLEGKGIDPSSAMSNSTIILLLREMDDIKSQLSELKESILQEHTTSLIK